jgi:hypothetical protein
MSPVAERHSDKDGAAGSGDNLEIVTKEAAIMPSKRKILGAGTKALWMTK